MYPNLVILSKVTEDLSKYVLIYSEHSECVHYTYTFICKVVNFRSHMTDELVKHLIV